MGPGGYIRLFGNEEEKEVRKSRSRMGALVENAGFFPKMSVEKNLEYYRIQRGIPGKDPVEAVLHTETCSKKEKSKARNCPWG